MMSRTKIHAVSVTSRDGEEGEGGEGQHGQEPPSDCESIIPRSGHSAIATRHPSNRRNRPDPLEVEELGIPGVNVHAPFPGLHGACEGCGTSSLSGLGSDTQSCVHCHRRVVSVVTGEKTGGGAPRHPGKEVAVTCVREIALSGEHIAALQCTGAVMLGTSSLLFILLLITWRGVDFSLVPALSPWLVIYLPIPLGLLDGWWSLSCARSGHVRHQTSGVWATCAGFCGTAWGCSGPACAINLGLDLGLLIASGLAVLTAGASARGCGYACYFVPCFPCAPGGGDGVAAIMVLVALAMACAVGFKMWAMKSILPRAYSSEGFLPW